MNVYAGTHILNPALEEEDGQHHAPAVLPPRKNPSRIVQEAEWA